MNFRATEDAGNRGYCNAIMVTNCNETQYKQIHDFVIKVYREQYDNEGDEQ